MTNPGRSMKMIQRRAVSYLLVIILIVVTLPMYLSANLPDVDNASKELLKFNQELSTLDATIQKELDAEISIKIDSSPKGEFETTSDYEQRMLRTDELRRDIQKQYERIKAERKLATEKDIELLREQIFESPVSISLKNYRADIQRFPFFIKEYNQRGSLGIPREIAEEFKKNIGATIVTGHFQLDANASKRLVYVTMDYHGESYSAITDRKLKEVTKLVDLGSHRRYINAGALSPDGKWLATAGEDKIIQIWNLGQEKQSSQLIGHVKYISSLAWHPLKDELISASDEEGNIYFWNMEDQTLISKLLNVHDGGILSIAVSPDGRYFATAGRDRLIRIWEYDSRKMLFELEGHSDAVKRILFGPDGDRLASAGEDGLLIQWNPLTGEKLQSVRAHTLWINAMAYSPDGQFIVTTSDDAKCKIWNAADLTLFKELSECTKPVTATCFTQPDGFLLMTANDNYDIQIWNLGDGSLVKTIESSHQNDISVLLNSLGGNKLISAGKDKQVALWNMDFDEFGMKATRNLLASGNAGLPPNCQSQIRFVEPSGNNILDANETGGLEIKIINNGQGMAQNIMVSLFGSVPRGLYYPVRTETGNILAGDSLTVTIPLEARYNINSQDVSLVVNILEGNGFNLGPSQVLFKTQKYFADITVAGYQTDDPNGDGMISVGEVVSVTTRVQNSGTSVARDVKSVVKIGKGVFFAGESAREKAFEINNLNAGDFKDITFQIYANNEAPDTLPVAVTLSEYYGQWGKENNKLPLLFQKPVTTMQTMVVKGNENAGDASASEIIIDIEDAIPVTIRPKTNAYALVIGNRNYQNDDIPDVAFAHRDAQYMKQYLIKSFGYLEGNIFFYKDATQSQFKTAIQKLKNVVQPGSEVFVYYVGHGAPDPEEKRGYFVPVDADPNYVSIGGVGLDEFYNEINALPAAQVNIVVDACFSGSSDQGMIIKNISPVMIEVENAYKVNQNLVEFTSSGGDEVSSWYPGKKHSLYTYFYLKGIQGSADANQDSLITVGELQNYLVEQVPYEARRLNNRQQTPGVTEGRDELVLVTYKKKTDH